ncbi:cytochrome P450 [Infundibulicybe gibba]|nr:cytochrome P450 [Infundibulicybe gibba]
MASYGLSLLINILLAGYIYKCFRRPKRSHPFPPGPKPKPIVGNALDIPAKNAWITYSQWAEKYRSDILHVEALGQHIIVLSSLEDATELLEKRASIYSSRPSIPMLDLMEWVDFNVGFLPHGDIWRHHRRVLQQCFKKDAVATYDPIHMSKVHQMLKGLLASPENLQMHIRTVAAAVIMAIIYGHDVSAMDDRFVTIAETAIDQAGKALIPGAFLVNTFPVLRHLPPWFPGAEFHRTAKKIKKLTSEMQNRPFDFVRKNMKDGTGRPSLLANLLEANDNDGGSKEQEEILKGVSATAYAAGADTTVSSIATFFYTMAVNLDVRRKAQQEIDMVIGNDRLPESQDRQSLPYVEALYREIMRWRPALPLGVPHASTEDDVYKGYFIPKGSIVFANIWSMSRSEAVHKNPDKFDPERHLDGQGRLKEEGPVLAFGFGRRICPGRHIASSTVWHIIACVLSTFDISKAKDANGNEIEIEGKYTDGAVSHPHPFPCSITPRSSRSRELINSDPLY